MRIKTITEALDHIKSSSTIVTAMAAAEPQSFFSNLHHRAKALKDVVVVCANPSKVYPCFNSTEMATHLRFEVMFLTSAVRSLQGADFLHYVPQHLSQWTRNLLKGQPIDVFWGSCSVPDSRGLVSLGPGCVYESEILRNARAVVLEINKNIPVTTGGTLVRVSDVSCFVESHSPLPTIESVIPGVTDKRIAQYVADLISDGSTIQLGIGGIPNAVALELRSKKDLGVHTEMINDAMKDLFLSGVITGKRKSLWPDKIVGAFAYGSKDLYDFINHNPLVELHPASIVNDPYRIGRNYKMTSINTAVEIDITGQICSESVGHQQLSGVGGAFDTHVGAQRSDGGRGIIAMHSTGTKSATQEVFSKIAFTLKPGAKVSISRNDVDTVITEYGVAMLRGQSVAERARALISISHPQFRDELTHSAKTFRYL
jgi:acyl-CoA hydrolase